MSTRSMHEQEDPPSAFTHAEWIAVRDGLLQCGGMHAPAGTSLADPDGDVIGAGCRSHVGPFSRGVPT